MISILDPEIIKYIGYIAYNVDAFLNAYLKFK